ITGSANYMWNSMSNGSPFKNFRWSSMSSVGLTLAFPLFQGGQRYHKQKQAEIAVREMKWQRDNLERSLHTQVQVQIDNLNKSLKQIESNDAGVKQATKASEIMNKSFKIGAASFIQLRDTDDALMNARLSYYQAIFNYLVADSDLEYVLGNSQYAN
ncbi:MAG: TolC family protein, partial [Bacteroidales bacterium]|nr:TolC family protein [Candidatus Sodaliphilus fimicaballi]